MDRVPRFLLVLVLASAVTSTVADQDVAYFGAANGRKKPAFARQRLPSPTSSFGDIKTAPRTRCAKRRKFGEDRLVVRGTGLQPGSRIRPLPRCRLPPSGSAIQIGRLDGLEDGVRELPSQIANGQQT